MLSGALTVLSAQITPTRDPGKEFTESIRPVLAENCGTCHNPNNGRNPANFLKAQTAKDIEAQRGLWKNVAAQMRNRSMPPIASKLTEQDRLRVATWVEDRLRETACTVGSFAGAVAIRRLNRREYRNTIRDLLGVDLDVTDILPADGSGGSGFDTNGETLYVGQLLSERYLEAAQQALDRAIITQPFYKTYTPSAMTPPTGAKTGERNVAAGDEMSSIIPAFAEGKYEVRVTAERSETPLKLDLKIDGTLVGALTMPAARGFGGGGGGRGNSGSVTASIVTQLERGTHSFSIVAGAPASITAVAVEQKLATKLVEGTKALESTDRYKQELVEGPTPERRALHFRLLGTEPGREPLQARKTAERVLAAFMRQAFRRPVQPAEVNRILVSYDRAAQRGDPYEERMKLALKTVLVSPDFLFKIEGRQEKPGIYQIGQYEMATRLSYFLWSTMPDQELFQLADQGKLQDPKVLAAQVDRMLEDPRSSAFTTSFTGQWLGTQDLGGRVQPFISTLSTSANYNAESAADLRQEPVRLLERIIGENRSLLELLTADYTYLTERLVKYYQLDGRVDVHGNDFQLVTWPDNRRAGLLGMAAPLAITSQRLNTSPVLRGAWVLETLLGTPVPPPPPGVPPLPSDKGAQEKVTVRQKLLQHRGNPTCATCHNLMDPIGFGLENFDGLGRWRDQDVNGQAIDATGTLPSGEKFNGPVELRQALLAKKGDFLEHLTGKVLGYALGRSLQDGDSCTVQGLTQAIEKDNYRARTMFREIVLSTPFRNTQGGVVAVTSAPPAPKRTQRLIPCTEDGSCTPLKKPETPAAAQPEVK